MTVLPALRPDGSLNVVVESPRRSTVKFKFDPDDNVMTLSRPLPLGLAYPCDWGFIPSTLASDGDPLDAFVLWDGVSFPGVVLRCRAIGVLKVEQTNRSTRKRERNDRIAVLPLPSPRHDDVRSVRDVPKRVREELEQFFTAAVAFERKRVEMLGWDGPRAAMAMVKRAIAAAK